MTGGTEHSGLGTFPLVSLIVPCRNEERSIGRVFCSLLAQDYPADRIEILFVDGMSCDGTRALISKLSRTRKSPAISIIDNPERVTPAAFNVGIAASRGDIIFTLGAHTEYSRNYVSAAVAAMQETGADAVGSVAETLPGAETEAARAIAAALSCPFGVGDSLMRIGVQKRQYADTASCPGYRREVFSRVGLFNSALLRNQDIEFNMRLRRTGGTILIEPAMRSLYYARATLDELARNAFANGYWVIRAAGVSRLPFRLRHVVPFGFLVGLAAAGASAALWKPACAGILALTGTYLAAVAVASLSSRSPKLLLFVVFPTLHVSYGLGSAWAAVTFAWRNRNRQRGKYSAFPEGRA